MTNRSEREKKERDEEVTVSGISKIKAELHSFWTVRVEFERKIAKLWQRVRKRKDKRETLLKNSILASYYCVLQYYCAPKLYASLDAEKPVFFFHKKPLNFESVKERKDERNCG